MTKKTKKIELKRVGMNLPISLTERVEDYAYNMGLNVTNAYIVLLNQALDYKDTLSNLPIITSAINSLKDITVQNDNDNTDSD